MIIDPLRQEGGNEMVQAATLCHDNGHGKESQMFTQNNEWSIFLKFLLLSSPGGNGEQRQINPKNQSAIRRIAIIREPMDNSSSCTIMSKKQTLGPKPLFLFLRRAQIIFQQFPAGDFKQSQFVMHYIPDKRQADAEILMN